MKRQYLGIPTSKILFWCGAIGILGSVAVILTNIIGSVVVEGHNPASDTISNLAIEKKAWIQDTGLNIFVTSFFGCATGFSILNLGDWKWKSGVVALFLISIDLLIISEYNQYANSGTRGATVHLYCVYILGILFALSSLLLSFGLRRISHSWSLFSLATTVSWVMLSPIFFMMPTAWDGAYERLLALIAITWVSAMSILLIQNRLRFC